MDDLLNIEDYMDEDISAFEGVDDIEDELDFTIESEQKRYINPGKKNKTTKPVKYRHAYDLAQQIGNFKKDDRYFIMLDGNFVFGDFLEAWIIGNKYNVLDMTISTLSLSQNNVDSLKTLIVKDYVQNLNLIVSDYFWAHERQYLIPYIYHELDVDDKFQLAVARIHTKICLLQTACGRDIVIHGSANLRTSGNVEQVVIEDDEDLFKFNREWHNEVLQKYKTIKKSVGGKYLWQQDQGNGQDITHPRDTTGQAHGQKQTLRLTSAHHLQKAEGSQHPHEQTTMTSRSKNKGRQAW